MLDAELTDVGLFGSMPRYGDLCIHAAVDLRRAFSRADLERAAEATVRDFPVLGRRYEARFWRDRWAPVEGPVADAVRVVEEAGDVEHETRAWVRRRIDPTRDRPFRIVSIPRGEGSRILLSVLHLAVDGAGMAAIAHVLGAHLYGVPPAVPVDPERNPPRVLERVRWYHAPVLAKDLAAALLQPFQMLGVGRRERHYPRGEGGPAAAAAGPEGGAAAGASAEASFRHLVLSAGDVARLKERCKGAEASINDVLVAALARVAAGRTRTGNVAVMYTMDLRRYASSPRLWATNASSILPVVLPRDAIGDLATTAGAVAAVTARQRRSFEGPAFILALMSMAAGAPHAYVRQLLRVLHPALVDAPLARGMMLSNVGRLDEGLHAFGPDVEDIRVIGPAIEGIGIPAVVAFGFRGRLYLELYAAPGIAPEALDELEGELYAALELPAVESRASANLGAASPAPPA